MIKNQIKVLLQRVLLAGRKPTKILLPQYLKDALRMEMQGSADYVKNTYPTDDLFFGIPVNTDKFATEILIRLEPNEKTSTGVLRPEDAPGSIGPHMPNWQKQKYNIKFKGKKPNNG
jgi:hypothetical protein